MAHLSIRVLGPLEVRLDGEPVSGFATDKVRALLAYLALSPDRPHRREALAGLLWPEFPERSARTNLRNALANLRKVISDDPRDVHPSAWIGLAARGLDQRHEAWQHLATALEWASRHQEFRELMVTLAGIALLLVDVGQIERAVELYALASRYPFVANSCWFADVAGNTLAEVAATLPAERVAVLRERGRTRDLKATAAKLFAELSSQ